MRKISLLLVAFCLLLWAGVGFADEVCIKSSVGDAVYTLQPGQLYEVKDLLHQEVNQRPYTLLGPVKLAVDFFGELTQRLLETSQPVLLFHSNGKLTYTVGAEFIIQEEQSFDWIGGYANGEWFLGLRSKSLSLPGRLGEVFSKFQPQLLYWGGKGVCVGLSYEFR